jgi:hypothetical protein
MPIIDVSQKTYRSLVKAAHKRGMSIDRYIQAVARPQIGADGSNPGVESEPKQPITAAPVLVTPLRKPISQPAREPASRKPVTASGLRFSALWGRIEQSAGEAISTKRGQDFTYEVESGYLTVVESGARIPQSQFKKALGQWPQNGPSNMRGIYAASVVWAVLADERIIADAA